MAFPHFALIQKMSTSLGTCPRAAAFNPLEPRRARSLLPKQSLLTKGTRAARVSWRSTIRASNDGNSYLDMWRTAVDRERKAVEFQKIAGDSAGDAGGGGEGEDLEKKSEDFRRIVEASKEERDRIQRMQVIDRAAAAIAAVRAIVNDKWTADDEGIADGKNYAGAGEVEQGGTENGGVVVTRSETSSDGVPGPDFWSWTPPPKDEENSDRASDLQTARTLSVYTIKNNPVAMKQRTMEFLPIPFQSTLSEPPIPPLQSAVEAEKTELFESSLEMPGMKEEEREIGSLFAAHAAEAAHVLYDDEVDELSSHGVNRDGARWWKQTGVERRPDGVICRWTMTRGVSADQDVEWQEKFWEAADDFGYKELGSEKSGRDAAGNVWREYWRESMWQDSGLVHLEKTADKWGRNGKDEEWQEKWWEHYDASGKAEKWADKWCSIDPDKQLEAGHAHVWHERWGEKFNGHGGCMKYTDKWAERCEGDGWSKWGDKWDEDFDPNGHGVKQGETWWEGEHGERWNRTWGERHNNSGWVHKYGKSSSGEHWDTHVQQDTWYERFPHYGFYHCFNNSIQLQDVQKPSEVDQP